MRLKIDQVFKTNDRVYHYIYGWGTVVDIHNGISQRILTEFDDIKNLVRDMYNERNILSFTEYTLAGFSQERPEELPKKGQIVWTRNQSPSEWEIGYFFKKECNTYYTSASKNSEGWWNAGLEIRTTNPYEDEEQRNEDTFGM